MSYGHHVLYVYRTGEQKRVQKAADTPFWLWEDGAMIPGLFFVAGSYAWASTGSLISIIVAVCVTALWFIALNPHELVRRVRLSLYVRSGRVLKVPESLSASVRDSLGLLPYDSSLEVPPKVFEDLDQALAYHFGFEANAPDKQATFIERYEATRAVLRAILTPEKHRRLAMAQQLEDRIAAFNAQQVALRRQYE